MNLDKHMKDFKVLEIEQNLIYELIYKPTGKKIFYWVRLDSLKQTMGKLLRESGIK